MGKFMAKKSRNDIFTILFLNVWVLDGIYRSPTHVKVVLKAPSKQMVLFAEEISLYFFAITCVSFELFHSGQNEGGPHIDSTCVL